jgi:DNA-binding transcriptional ArsR family regulator
MTGASAHRPGTARWEIRDVISSRCRGTLEELPTYPLHRTEVHPPRVDAAIVTAALIADRTRAAILQVLRDGPRCVCELAAATGIREAQVSVHLDRLRAAGLVRVSPMRSHAPWVFYERDETACEVALLNLGEVLGPALRAP